MSAAIFSRRGLKKLDTFPNTCVKSLGGGEGNNYWTLTCKLLCSDDAWELHGCCRHDLVSNSLVQTNDAQKMEKLL